ncbi:MAG: MFS transporter [Pseudomonadota bacterium]
MRRAGDGCEQCDRAERGKVEELHRNQSHPGLPSTGLAVTVLMVSSLTVMSNATIAPSLPGLSAAFATTPGIAFLTGLVLGLPSLSILVAAPVFGRAADQMDRQRLMIFCLVFYGAAGASGAFVGSMTGVLVGRVCLGVAVAGTMTLVTTLAGDYWQGAARERFMGRQTAAMSAGGVLFLLAGGALAEIDWRAPFLIYLCAWPLILPAMRFVPQGAAVAQEHSEDQVPIAFPWTAFALIGGLACFGMTMFYLVPTRLPFLLHEIGVMRPSAAGFAIAAMSIASVVTSYSFGQFRRLLSPAQVFALAYGAMATGFIAISMASVFGLAVVGAMIAGLGLGLTFPNQASWLMSLVPAQQRGRAAGRLTSAMFAGQIFSPVLSGAIDIWLETSALYLVFAGLLLIVAVSMLILPRDLGTSP